jgi:polysaccharide biosynthesis/export protein
VNFDMYLKLTQLCIIAVIIAINGCAGPNLAQQAQLISQAQSHKERSKLQEKFSQVGTSSLVNYKDYKVGAEDLLEVTFLGMDELGREGRVNGKGEVSLPLIGSVKVAGSTPSEIEVQLAQMYKEGKFLRNPQITVNVKEYRHQRVMVTGAVAQPGSYEMIGPRTLLEMLGKAGGLTEKSGDMVHIIRSQTAADLNKTTKKSTQSFSPGSETTVIDLRRLLVGGATELNTPIKNGDVIYVPPAKSAFVLGAVKKPGQVPVKDNITVSQALALTEGVDPMLGSFNVSVVRLDDQGQRIIIPVKLGRVVDGQDPDPLLKENDVVFVSESIIKRFLFNVRNLAPGSFSAGYTMVP